MSDFIKLRVSVQGSSTLLEEIHQKYFGSSRFDYNLLIPMPIELDIDVGSNLETGYDALYGDWRIVAKQWMLKEPAAALNYFWPLESREDVCSCIDWLDCSEFYFAPARAFKANLEKYGHGAAHSWMEENWGCDCNADKDRLETVFVDGELHFRLNVGSYPKLVFKKLSKLYPTLIFVIRYVNEYDRPGRSFVLKGGKEAEKHKLLPEQLKGLVHGHPLNETWESI